MSRSIRVSAKAPVIQNGRMLAIRTRFIWATKASAIGKSPIGRYQSIHGGQYYDPF